MRESGAAIDTFVLQLADLPAPTGDGPAATAVTMDNAAERNVIAHLLKMQMEGLVVPQEDRWQAKPPASDAR